MKGVYGRAGGRTLRHNQIFSVVWFTKFSYPCCCAARALRARESSAKKCYRVLIVTADLRKLSHSHLDPLRTQVEWIDSVTKKRDIININPLLNSQNLTTFGIQVYSCNLNYFLALDPINLQISFNWVFALNFRALFIISKIQRMKTLANLWARTEWKLFVSRGDIVL